jgi:hypothetical protein
MPETKLKSPLEAVIAQLRYPAYMLAGQLNIIENSFSEIEQETVDLSQIGPDTVKYGSLVRSYVIAITQMELSDDDIDRGVAFLESLDPRFGMFSKAAAMLKARKLTVAV